MFHGGVHERPEPGDGSPGIRPQVECQPLPKVEFDAARIGRYWPKLGLMQEDLGGLEGMTLFLDLDLVFIDAAHTYEAVAEDIRAWLPKVRLGGVLCGDDYPHRGVRRAVGEALRDVELCCKRRLWVYRGDRR